MLNTQNQSNNVPATAEQTHAASTFATNVRLQLATLYQSVGNAPLPPAQVASAHTLFTRAIELLTANHPDCCNICNLAIVPAADRVCDCTFIACKDCLGKCQNTECPGCRKVPPKLIESIESGAIRISMAQLFTPDCARLKPLIETMRAKHHARIVAQQEGEILDNNGSADQQGILDNIQRDRAAAAPAQPGAGRRRPREEKEEERTVRPRREEGAEEEDSENEEKKEEERVRPAAAARAERIDTEIKRLLDHCWRHGDQRGFKELLTVVMAHADWSRSKIDVRPARDMDTATLHEQWFIMDRIQQSSTELRVLSRLRLGEFYDRLLTLCDENNLTHIDDHGHPVHFTSVVAYLRAVFKYQKREEGRLRSCHQFFAVWKEFHPIIGFSSSGMSWSWLMNAFTKDKLLLAVREFKEAHPMAQPVVLQSRAPLLPASLRATPPPALAGPTTLVLDSWYQPIFLSDPNAIMARLVAEVKFIDRQDLDRFELFGREVVLPRDKAFYGDVESDGSFPVYRYGTGDAFPTALAWTPVMLEIRNLITARTGQRCNHCVVNRYNDGEDHIGYHKDKTRDFAEGSHVITVSLGATRQLRIQDQDGAIVSQVDLEHGSLNVLGWNTNVDHKHAIAKSPDAGVRYGLTFRSMKTNSARFLQPA